MRLSILFISNQNPIELWQQNKHCIFRGQKIQSSRQFARSISAAGGIFTSLSHKRNQENMKKKNQEIKKEIKQFQQKKLCQVHFRRRWRTSAHPSHIKRYQENMKKNITKNRKTTSRNKKNCKVHLAKAGICGGHLHILATLFWDENVRRENRDSQTRNSQNAEIKQYNHVVPKISLCLLLSGGTKYGWFSYWWGLWLVTNWQWIKKISG